MKEVKHLQSGTNSQGPTTQNLHFMTPAFSLNSNEGLEYLLLDYVPSLHW